MKSNKIISLSNLSSIRKKNKSKIVLAHGTFDFIHYGHILHLKKAKTYGEILVVSITSDKFVNKGPGRPVYSDQIRLNFLSEFDFIDHVLISYSKSAVQVIKELKPNVYVKGGEYKNSKNDIAQNLEDEKKILIKFGGILKFTNEKTLSASSLLNYYSDKQDDNLKNYLSKIKKKINQVEVFDKLKKIQNKKVLIIGEAILDEYFLCESLAKSPKEEIISSRLIEKKIYLGGILATATHLCNFIDDVTLLTFEGQNHELNNYIKKNLVKKIKKIFFYDKRKKTILKSRFLEQSRKKKLFQVNNLDYHDISKETELKILNYLKKSIKNFDIVLINDFGHGLLTKKIVNYLSNFSRKLYVNVQSNSANLGYNFFYKYKKCKYLSIDEPEARLGTKSRFSNSKKLFQEVRKLTKFQICSITHGGHGTKIFSNNKIFNAPALTNQYIDTVGAGDAYFAISSIFASVEKNPELIAFFGNMSGAMKIQYLGHEKNIEKHKFIVYLKSLTS